MTEQNYIDLGSRLHRSNLFEVTYAKRAQDTGEFSVDMTAYKLFTPIEIEAIEKLICDRLSSKSVRLNIDYSDIIDHLSNCSDEELTETFLRVWSEFSPEIVPILANSKIAAERTDVGLLFRVNVPERYFSLLDMFYAAELRKYAAQLWKWSFSVELVPDPTITDIKTNGIEIPGGQKFTRAAVPHKIESDQVPAKNSRKPAQKKQTIDPGDIILGKEIVKKEITPMSEFGEDTGNAVARGFIINYEITETRDKSRTIFKLNFSDKTNTITAKFFPDSDKAPQIEEQLKKVQKDGDLIVARGSYKFDNYSKDYVFLVNDINRCPAVKRTDRAEGEKRVELHLHTQSSTMDALTKVSEVIATAASWGHKAIAITDHGVVHSLPEAMKAADKNKIKVIYGCEGYLVSDSTIHPLDSHEYTALAVTGSSSNNNSNLYEIQAIRFDSKGTIISEFGTLVNNGAALPAWAVEDCGITENEYNEAPDGEKAVGELLDFIKDSVVVAYNETTLDLLAGAIGDESRVPLEYVDINQLELNLHLDIKDYSMEAGCCPISGRYENVRRAPAKEHAGEIMSLAVGMMNELRERGLSEISWWDRRYPDFKKLQRYHIILLAASLKGLKNLYKLVSYSHLQYFHKRPCIPRSLLNMLREGILLGSACEAGELYRAITHGKPEEEQERIASWYDYLEIQPLDNNMFMVEAEDSKLTAEDLRNFNRRVIEIGDKLGKLTVATCDVHFQDPDDAIFRSILLHSQGFKDAVRMTPLYFRTTDEMLEEFSYLGKERAREVVITNPNIIAERCGEQLSAYLNEKFTYSPELPNAKEILEEMTMTEAHRRYGDPLPEIVQARLDKELKSIVGNGYSSLYMVAQKLVSKSLGDGYLVGSRGSVGSSFVATMLGITEVNALPPHYLCPNCKYSEFVPDAKSRCGIDLPDKVCPVCGANLSKEGYDIPFEVFLGFKGDKTPDIDLNFSGEYQPVAHHFTEEMFGAGHAFRAGTISGVQDKTVYGYVKHYCEDLGLHKSEAEINRLVQGCLGVKKTSGQHPGGIVIVPEDYEIFDFCPVQHPADKNDAGFVTTHFDFHALDDKLVKLDILGHDDPTVLRMLQDITGLDPRTIPLDDPETLSIYSTDKALGVSLEPLGCDVGSLAIPEFGTNFVRGMLVETRPKTMEELVRISGLSHGTDVWNNNAQVLVQNKVATLMEVICTRDDIMNYLISQGCDPSLSFKTMESVRKGRGLARDGGDDGGEPYPRLVRGQL